MAFWFFPAALSENGIIDRDTSAWLLPAENFPDISRAHSYDHILEWARQIHADQTPEFIAAKAMHLWRLGFAIQTDDYLVIEQGSELWLAEVQGPCARDMRGGIAYFTWPVKWIPDALPAREFKQLTQQSQHPSVFEINDAELVIKLKSHMPSMRRLAPTIFKWVSVTILVAELVYFWPKAG